MRWKFFLSLCLFSLFYLSCQNSCSQKSSKDDGPLVYFIAPKDGDTLSSPIEIIFGVKGMSVRPAMEDVNDKTSGHHHILIDSPKGFIEKGMPVPVDKNHIHYGKGQTSATIDLPVGTHTLSMQFADGAHLSYGKEMAATITVTVVEKENDKN
ncbi:MAG: DUF4399 domain-containing protein [Myxococcales bacterium]|nr:DUF4399 domain-containing protein [Myxococcales bacterium]USN49852.1 MAG: DUF4399 domain-containing protein [Myxococcales bacterium]